MINVTADLFVKCDNINQVFDRLLDFLEYKQSGNYHSKEEYGFDSYYSVEIEDQEYPIIGIKMIKEKDEKRINEIHRSHWNQNKVPFSIFVFTDEIRIYNNFTIGNNEKIVFSSNDDSDLSLELFSDASIVSGALWKKIEKLLSSKDRVDNYLLSNLRNTLKTLVVKFSMNIDCAYEFLAQCIFVKYMEDRGMLTPKVFSQYSVRDFVELLEKKSSNEIKGFFGQLRNRFNGDMFDLNNIVLPTSDQMRIVVDFFRAEEVGDDGLVQYSFLKYDFSKIPVELVSNIYETFFVLKDRITDSDFSTKAGAYYTPRFLVDFICNQYMSEHASNSIPKVLDISCGSGIFLVKMFQEIIRKNERNGKHLNPTELKNILLQSIYGVDINEEAVKLACFSLYVALLDHVEPKDIFENNFTFPNLIGHNLLCMDAFSKELDRMNISVDFVVGNPPWVGDRKGTHNSYCKSRKIPISDGQTAQAFLVRASDFIHFDGIVAQVVTNSIFTSENANEFRNYLYRQYRLIEVDNLSGVRTRLFLNAQAPCSIVTYCVGREELNYNFRYYSFRENLLSAVFDKLVFDKDKLIRIDTRIAKHNPYLWRVLEIGDNYDFRVVKQMKLNRTIKDYGYKCFEGYISGNKSKEIKEYTEYKGGNLKEGFAPYYINYDVLPYLRQSCFERPRKLEQFLAPCKLLVKRTFNRKSFGAAFCNEDIIFSNDYYCIYSQNQDDIEMLQLIAAIMNSTPGLYYIHNTSKIHATTKPELSESDLLSLPIPEFKNDSLRKTILKNVKSIVELLKTDDLFCGNQIDVEVHRNQDEIDSILYEAYELDEVEIATIKHTMSILYNKVDQTTLRDDTLREYISFVEKCFNVFLESTGSTLRCVYQKTESFYSILLFETDDSDQNGQFSLRNFADYMGLASVEDISSELIVKNRLSGFTPNGFFVIKENEMINWSIMSAQKDVDFFMGKILFDRSTEYV